MSENFMRLKFDATELNDDDNHKDKNYLHDLDDEELPEIQDEFEKFCKKVRKPKNLTQKDVSKFLCEPDPWCPDGNPRCNLGYDDSSIYDYLDAQND